MEEVTRGDVLAVEVVEALLGFGEMGSGGLADAPKAIVVGAGDETLIARFILSVDMSVDMVKLSFVS